VFPKVLVSPAILSISARKWRPACSLAPYAIRRQSWRCQNAMLVGKYVRFWFIWLSYHVIFDIYNIKIAIKSLVKEIDTYIDAKLLKTAIVWENIKGPSLGAIFFTVYHIFVANIVFKWRNNGILMRPKHLFITIEMSTFIYTTLYNDQCSIYCSKASFLTLFSVMKISYIILYFRRNSHRRP